MIGRLVEGRTPGEIAFKERVSDYVIPGKHIDQYSHVNHAAYQDIFAGIRTQEGIGHEMHVSAVSMRFGGQFVEGDTAKIKTEEYRRPQGMSLVEQEIRKPDTLPVRQATKLIPAHFASAVFPPLLYEPNGPQVMDTQSTVQTQNITHLPHTAFAPMFEQERINFLKERDVDIQSLMERGTVILVTDLNASFRKVHTDETSLTVTSEAHLQERKGEYPFMICRQIAQTSDGLTTSEQVVRLFFVNVSKSRISVIPPDLVNKFVTKQT